MAAVTETMAARTGRDLESWVELTRRDFVNAGGDPLDQRAVRNWLRDVHGVRQNSQWAIAFEVARRAGWSMPTVAEFVDQQYTGKKAVLRPVYDALAPRILALGEDVHAEGRATYIPFVRARQFAAVGPMTTTRVDVGLRFTAPPASERLEPAKAPGQATHRVRLATVTEVDDELLGLLRIAYEQNG